MGNHHASVIAEYRKLYGQLLECTKHQLDLLSAEESLERMTEVYLRSAENWEAISVRIDRMALEFPTLKEIQDAALAETMKNIQAYLHMIEARLSDSIHETGDGLRTVKDQKMLMNAYYGMDRRGYHSFYVDEKK
ncbi:hypothetical protein J25TS5_35060 [Paenibacillus faecis]|uniref:hypothetical protein n=1 Tax=Paenibacillus faecis TaxID=862114 RepID=UPI001B0B2410|nr:hypothetical protein [Paenibacillus faecis]GIO86574.1 hypothetical protein J25TS5_35060 [Paenibacillus faecis]